ncbi:MAG: formyl-CoA transferase [Dehalococcoidia bacterium]|nr:formyl-CoA transferase [Dehalococcoidia bacterium]
MNAVLNNIKVLDLTRTIAGPFSTMMLGDMGAEVIKIEEPENGDETRSWTPFWNGESSVFVAFNRNKRGISVNLKEQEGIDLVLSLAKEADIVVESFRAGALDRMGLGYGDIKAINPDIIYCSISGYGRTGPLANKPGYDLLIQAYSSLMNLTGETDGMPMRVGFSLVDLFTGMMAYGSMMTALYHRNMTGKGQWIEAALLDGQVAAMSYHGTAYLATGVDPLRMGSGHPSLVPYQSFAGSDGNFILGVANAGLWQRFCNAIEHPELLEDPRFRTNDDRVVNRSECVQVLNNIFGTNTVSYWVDKISEAGVPCGPINRVSDVVNDPHVLSRDMISGIEHPNIPDLRFPGSPLKLTETPPSIRRAPPLLGQHNDEILCELGYSPDSIDSLRGRGVIGKTQMPNEKQS